MNYPVSLYPCQCAVLSLFLILASLLGVQWYPTGALTCILLMALFMWVLIFFFLKGALLFLMQWLVKGNVHVELKFFIVNK